MPKTIWSKGSMPLVPKRFRGLYQWVLPLGDLGMILFGIVSYTVGSKVVTHFTLPWFSPAWAILTFAGGLLALTALVFMRDGMEAFARLIVGVGMLIYCVATFSFILDGTPSSSLTLILTILRVSSTVWRLIDLWGEIGRKQAAHA